MENYIVLKNGIRVDIDQESTETSLAVSFKNITEFADFVNELTLENLKRILVYAGDVVVAEYENRRVKQIKVEPGNKIKAEIELEKITDLEIELERVKEIVNVQDKAIEDISAMTTSFAENIGIDEKNRGGYKMIAFYVYKIIHGLKELEDVPKFWRERVKNRLEEMKKNGEIDGNYRIIEVITATPSNAVEK